MSNVARILGKPIVEAKRSRGSIFDIVGAEPVSALRFVGNNDPVAENAIELSFDIEGGYQGSSLVTISIPAAVKLVATLQAAIQSAQSDSAPKTETPSAPPAA
jgi:hypothetical protein